MLKTFNYGGVHPPENKFSSGEPIERLELPDSVFISTAQHVGSPADIIVSKGDQVLVGQLIAKADGYISANVHASVSGKVVEICNAYDPSGFMQQGVRIKVDGDQWLDSIIRNEELVTDFPRDRDFLRRAIEDFGIIGLGGGAFPTHVKVNPPADKPPEYLIINGVECEPFLTADHRLMLEKGPEIIVGTKILMHALNVKKAFVGIEANKPDAIEHMSQLVKNEPEIEVVPLKVKYPQGGEKLLIKAITGREMPINGLPFDVGVVVHNTGTAFAIYEAIQKKKPLIERVVTVTGRSLERPCNFLVRMGTPLGHLINTVGGLPEDTGKIILGGPMMGRSVRDTSIPVNKSTSGVLLVPDERSLRDEEMTCIRCGRCVEACCMGLEPYLLMFHSERHLWDKAAKNHIMNCIECGSCSYICPSKRPLLDYIRIGKKEARKLSPEKSTLIKRGKPGITKKFTSLLAKKND